MRLILTLKVLDEDMDLGDCMLEAERLASLLTVDIEVHYMSHRFDTDVYTVRYDNIEDHTPTERITP